MATLQVLCPNGRRQNVKITPNTKLLQVLEDVCQKQKFLPAEDYSLKHGRNTLDLTLSMRYANLSNNAKLELVKCEKSRAESAVLIALQLEGGERLQGEFEPGTTLWELLQHWEGQEEGKYAGKLAYVDSSTTPPLQPVCIYMREEVTGEFALQETLLRTLGLTGGRAVIRLLHRSVEDSVLTEIKTKIEKEKQRKARLAASTDSRESARQNAVNELRDIPGIEVFSPNDFNDLPPDQQRVAKRLAQALFSSMGASGQGPAISQGGANSEGGARKKKPAPKQQQQPTFANFKAQLVPAAVVYFGSEHQKGKK
ncbi:ASPC1-like protein [Mya arenaria]|uniref:ASPC1-like protein n=1 Tax=Mya arenaria TaxID=6604 RepID=A0ABY7DLQ5_MYAAR|nr:ASPC1-like protein [Mya arenaria]